MMGPQSRRAVSLLAGVIQAALMMSSAVFVGEPGRVLVDLGGTATLQWGWSPRVMIRMGVSRGPGKDPIMFYDVSQGCETYGNSRLSCVFVDSGSTIGIRISGVTAGDVGQYTCLVQTNNETSFVENSNATLGVYVAPAVTMAIDGTPLTEGVSTTVRCSSRSTSLPVSLRTDSNVVCDWTIDDELPSSVYNITGSRMTLGPVTRQHHGSVIRCTCHEEGSELTASKSVTLDIHYPPGKAILTASPTTVIEREGNILFTCTVSDRGNPAAASYRFIKASTSQTISREQNTYTLSVSNVATTQGTWQCQAQNSVGTGAAGQVYVRVNAKPVEVKVSADVVLDITSSFMIACEFLAKPAANITWQLSGPETLSADFMQTATSQRDGPYTLTNSRLSWKPGTSDAVKRQTGGQYHCLADNGVGEVVRSSRIMVQMRYPPYQLNLTPNTTSLTFTEGSTVNVTCHADCIPACTYTWTGNNLYFSDGPLLYISSISRSQGQVYTCTARNDLGTSDRELSISVNYPPEIRFSDSTIEEGGTFRLTCTVDSRPPSDISVYAGDTLLRQETASNAAIYTFNDIKCLDTGQYRCSAQNGIGSNKQKLINLNVQCPPQLYSVSPSGGMDGQPLGGTSIFTVTVIGNPTPDVSWTFGNGRVYLPGNVNVSRTRVDGVLVDVQVIITGVREENYGSYNLQAYTNTDNRDIITLYLKPRGPPGKPSNLMLVRATAVSLYISWTAGFNGGMPQTFVVQYTAANKERQKDTVFVSSMTSTGDLVVYRLMSTGDLVPGTGYDITVTAQNDYGMTQSETVTYKTKERPGFINDPTATLKSTNVTLSWSLINVDSLTHLMIQVCVSEDMTSCHETNLTDLDVNKITLPLPASGASSFDVIFAMYDGQDMVYQKDLTVSKGLAAGVITGIAIAVIVVIILILAVMVYFIRRKQKNQTRQHPSKEEISNNYSESMILDDSYITTSGETIMDDSYMVTTRGGEYYNMRSDAGASVYYNTVQPQVSQETDRAEYEDVQCGQLPAVQGNGQYTSLSGQTSSQEPETYTSLSQKTMVQYKRQDIQLGELVKKGSIFDIVRATSQHKNLTRQFVVKKLKKDIRDGIYTSYIEGAAETLLRLHTTPNILNCLGITQDKRWLLLESSPQRTLRQHLISTNKSLYTNKADSTPGHYLLDFILQCFDGFEAVTKLEDPKVLFFCLSTDHVLLCPKNVCKLIGCAPAHVVRQREVYEREKSLSANVRWMAPETVTRESQHMQKSDIWGFAVLMWEIFSYGELPYASLTDEARVAAAITGGQNLEKPSTCTEQVYGLMKLCWSLKANDRPSVADIQTVLQEAKLYENLTPNMK